MTKKKRIIAIFALLALISASAFAFFVFININEKPPIVVNQADNQPTNESIAMNENTVAFSSTFSGVDAIHWGRGGLQVLQTTDGPVLSFGEDFEVAQGPDLFVYLSPNPAGQELGEFASLGSLKAIKGAQNYTLPVNYESYKTVVIWCRAFSTTFATAELQK